MMFRKLIVITSLGIAMSPTASPIDYKGFTSPIHPTSYSSDSSSNQQKWKSSKKRQWVPRSPSSGNKFQMKERREQERPIGDQRQQWQTNSDPSSVRSQDLQIGSQRSPQSILDMLSKPVQKDSNETPWMKFMKHTAYSSRERCNSHIRDLKAALNKVSGVTQETLQGIHDQIIKTRDDYTLMAWKEIVEGLETTDDAQKFKKLRSGFDNLSLMTKNCGNQARVAIYKSGVRLPSYTYPPEKKCYGAQGSRKADPTFNAMSSSKNSNENKRKFKNPFKRKSRKNKPDIDLKRNY